MTYLEYRLPKKTNTVGENHHARWLRRSDTNHLIENTIKAVEDGGNLTKMTQKAFEENVAIAQKIGQLIDEIATASEEQSRGISQVNIAVLEMNKVTQETAANAEESASASEELNAQAEQMKSYVRDLIMLVGGSHNGAGVFERTIDRMGKTVLALGPQSKD
ncbi:MAG TPA: methyl-accepting chemotaxis protein [Syntrophales bacterium]|nr:methyl-accepting chemotaxis protein [Syntrophales bacterium]